VLAGTPRFDGDVVADVIVGRLEIGTGHAVHDWVRHRIQNASPSAGLARRRMFPHPARRRRIHVADAVEAQLADEGALELRTADPIREREGRRARVREPIHTGTEKGGRAGIRLAGGQPQGAVRGKTQVADREAGKAVGQRRKALPIVAGSEDAAVRAAEIDIAGAYGYAHDPSGHEAGTAARIRRQRIAVARIVRVVRTVGHLGPRRPGHRQRRQRGEGGAVRARKNDPRRGSRLGKLLTLRLRFGRLVSGVADLVVALPSSLARLASFEVLRPDR
jgi:hypothetical protein